jgi:hypothetical protein
MDKAPGILCTHEGCLASVSWVGHPADEMLADYARDRGWAKSLAGGWLCPRHIPVALSQAPR